MTPRVPLEMLHTISRLNANEWQGWMKQLWTDGQAEPRDANSWLIAAGAQELRLTFGLSSTGQPEVGRIWKLWNEELVYVNNAGSTVAPHPLRN